MWLIVCLHGNLWFPMLCGQEMWSACRIQLASGDQIYSAWRISRSIFQWITEMYSLSLELYNGARKGDGDYPVQVPAWGADIFFSCLWRPTWLPGHVTLFSRYVYYNNHVFSWAESLAMGIHTLVTSRWDSFITYIMHAAALAPLQMSHLCP